MSEDVGVSECVTELIMHEILILRMFVSILSPSKDPWAFSHVNFRNFL